MRPRQCAGFLPVDLQSADGGMPEEEPDVVALRFGESSEVDVEGGGHSVLGENVPDLAAATVKPKR